MTLYLATGEDGSTVHMRIPVLQPIANTEADKGLKNKKH